MVSRSLGASSQPAKSFALGRDRHYLGTSIHVGDFGSKGLICFNQQAFTTATKILRQLSAVPETSTLSPDDALSLRGDLNRMFSMCAVSEKLHHFYGLKAIYCVVPRAMFG